MRLGRRRETQEWGAAYSVVMTEACEHVGEPRLAWLGEPPKRVHDRMPAMLPREDWGDWLDGPPDAAGLLCRPYELGMRVERTGESWVQSRVAERR